VPHVIELTLDCANAEPVAAFWRTAVGYVDEPPPAPYVDRREWLASLGEHVGERVGGAWLIDAGGVAPRLALIEVPEPKTAKNRLHLDLRVSDASTSDERWRQVLREVTGWLRPELACWRSTKGTTSCWPTGGERVLCGLTRLGSGESR